MIGGRAGLAGPVTCLENFIDTGIQGLVVNRRCRVLSRIKHLEGQDFLAMQQFDALVRIDHHGHALPT